MIIILAILSLVGCRTKKVQTNTQTKISTGQISQTQKLQQVQESLSEREKMTAKRVQSFGYDFTLKSVDSTQPARIVEYREGKPYREIVAKNAVYTEKKSQKDRTESQKFSQVAKKIIALEFEKTTQQEEIHHLKTELKETKTNTKYLLWCWLLILAALLVVIVYFGYYFKKN